MGSAEPSAAQRLKYLECGLQVEAGLENAVRVLRLQRAKSADPVESVRLEVRAQRLEAERARVHSDLLESLTGPEGLHLPREDARSQIADLSDAILGASADSAPSSELVAMAHLLVDRWRGAESEGDVGSSASEPPRAVVS